MQIAPEVIVVASSILLAVGVLVAWRLRRAWRTKESAYRQMFEANPLPMWVYDLETLRFLAVNDAAVQHYGYSRAEFLAMTIKDIRPKEDVPALLENVAHVTEGLDLAGGWRHIKSDGTRIDVEITSHTLRYDGRKAEAVLAYDVTERTRNRAALQAALDEAERSGEKLSALLASVADGLVGIDLDGRISFANQAARELLGLTVAAAQMPLLDELPATPLVAYLREVCGRPHKARTETIELFARHDAPPRIFQARTAPVTMAGAAVAGSITSLQELTRERELEQMKSEFVATAAHELLTPITTVMGYSELLLREREFGTFDSQQVREFLAKIFAKAEVLERIVDDLLCLGKIEAGRPILLERRPHGLIELVQDVIRLQRLEHPGRELVLDAPGRLPPLALDEKRIRQVFDNLLNNAFKFSSPDSPVCLSVRLSGADVHVAVIDRGCGMTPEQSAQAFHKFYRAKTGNTGLAGLGLGLTIAKRIVEGHGGSIRLDSRKDEGTTVTVTLPLGF